MLSWRLHAMSIGRAPRRPLKLVRGYCRASLPEWLANRPGSIEIALHSFARAVAVLFVQASPSHFFALIAGLSSRLPRQMSPRRKWNSQPRSRRLF
ncbi:hypothetical protein D3C79_922240 [compost metagenome]